MPEQDPGYLLGVAIGFSVVPYFVIYLVFVLVTRRVIPIPTLLAGMLAAVVAALLVNLAGQAWLGGELLKTPVPMFGGVLSAAAVISLLGKWKGRPTSEG
jgi:hypothetical protein